MDTPIPAATSGRAAFFDIFDTVLVRRVGTPESVFLLLGRRLREAGLVRDAAAFAAARVAAEHAAQQAADPSTDRQFTLDDVYATLANVTGMDADTTLSARRAELALEAELLLPVPAGVIAVADARRRGDRVAFVSDTYFDPAFLEQQLARHGLFRAGDALIASCVERIGKASGGLFGVAMGRLGVDAASVKHRGNSLPLDIAPARARGIAVEHFDEGNASPYERTLCDSPHATPLSAGLAGAARLARLDSSARSDRDEGIIRVAAGVVAPALIGFSLWLLREAESLGIDRLCFLARDGQVLEQVTRRLSVRIGARVDTSYVYASRKVWNLAALTEIDAGRMGWVLEDTPFLSASVMVHRLGLRTDDLRQEFESIGLPRRRWADNLTPQERLRLRELILTDSSVRRLVLERAAAQRSLVLDALRAQGLMATDRILLVDLGWHGSMQLALRRMVGEAGPALHGRYFGLYRHAPAPDARDTMAGWFVDASRGDTGRIRRLSQLGFLMETFCAADHGTTVGYERSDDGVRPRLDPGFRPLAVEWGLPTLRQTLDAVVDRLPIDLAGVRLDADVREPVRSVLERFWFEPDPRDARAWGTMPVDDRLGHAGGSQRLAAAFGMRDVAAAAVGAFERPGRADAWFRGSLAQSPRITRKAMSAACRLGRLWTRRPRRPEDAAS
jgi:FMN phosphatase YigB (HAD superfamily)